MSDIKRNNERQKSETTSDIEEEERERDKE